MARRLAARRCGARAQRMRPEFLGLLRDKLNPQLRALVQHEIHKNLAHEDAAAIRARLPERLFPAL